jgi:hypothetical protein
VRAAPLVLLVLLDEATAAADPRTAALMHQVRFVFQSCIWRLCYHGCCNSASVLRTFYTIMFDSWGCSTLCI